MLEIKFVTTGLAGQSTILGDRYCTVRVVLQVAALYLYRYTHL